MIPSLYIISEKQIQALEEILEATGDQATLYSVRQSFRSRQFINKDDNVLDELKGAIEWGDKFGSDMIKGYITARITHIERDNKELLKQTSKQKCKPVIFTKNELKLLITLLDMAGNEFGNHGCNDVEEEIYDGWTLEERRAFVKKFEEYNGSPEDYNENHLHLQDYCLFSYFKHKLMEML